MPGGAVGDMLAHGSGNGSGPSSFVVSDLADAGGAGTFLKTNPIRFFNDLPNS